MKNFLKNILIFIIGMFIIFILFTVLSIRDAYIGIYNQDNYCFDKENVKILHGGIEQ